MAEDRGDAAAVRLFPPAVPLAIVLLGVALQYLYPITPGFSWPPLMRYLVGSATIVGSILGLGLWAVLLVRRSGQSENPWKLTIQVIQRGPFRVTRNPMYLQMVLVCVGFSVLLWNPWILALTPIGAWLLHRLVILPEEAYLERKFGDDYRGYKRRVRRWI